MKRLTLLPFPLLATALILQLPVYGHDDGRLSRKGNSISSKGTIHVGPPQVNTRERLQRERTREYYWLEEQLENTPTELELSAFSDERFYNQLLASITATYNPLGTDLKGANLEKARNDVSRAEELAQRQHLVDVALKERKLAAVQNPDAPVEVVTLPSEDISQINSRLDEISGKVSVLEDKAETATVSSSGNITDQFALSADAKLPGDSILEKNGSSAAHSKVKGTSLELLKDQLAYRDFISAAQRDRMLDDTHDLNGNTQYDLSIPLGLTPPEGEQRYAVINIQAIPQSTSTSVQQDFKRYQQALTKLIYMEYQELEQRGPTSRSIQYLHYREHYKANRAQLIAQLQLEKAQVDARVGKAGNDVKGILTDIQTVLPEAFTGIDINQAVLQNKTTDEVLKQATRTLTESTAAKIDVQRVHPKPPVATSDIKLSDALALIFEGEIAMNYLAQKYSQLVGPKNDHAKLLFLPQDPAKPATLSDITLRNAYTYYDADKQGYRYSLAINENDDFNAAQQTVQAIKNSRSNSTPVSIRRVEPIEMAQNVSQVVAQERVIGLMASLNAVFGDGDVNAAIQNIQRNRAFYDTITRKPLAVGFINGSDSFGWVLGPKFGLENRKRFFGLLGQEVEPTSEHEVVNHNFNVSLVAHSSIRKMTLKVTAQWHDPKTGIQKQKIAIGKPSASGPITEQSIEVDLRADDNSHEATLLAFINKQRQPVILPFDDNGSLHSKKPNYIITNTENERGARLLIPGHDLWRSPAVYVGNHKAKEVYPLPGLNGIFAQFNAPLPTGTHNLTVITSEGMDVLPNAVSVSAKPTPKPSKVGPYLQLQETYVDNWNGQTTGGFKVRFKKTLEKAPPVQPFLTGAVYLQGQPWKPVACISTQTGDYVDLVLPAIGNTITTGKYNVFEARVETWTGNPPKSVGLIAGRAYFTVFKNGANTLSLTSPSTALNPSDSDTVTVALSLPEQNTSLADHVKTAFKVAYPQLNAAETQLKLSGSGKSVLLKRKGGDKLEFLLDQTQVQKLASTTATSCTLELLMPDKKKIAVSGTLTVNKKN